MVSSNLLKYPIYIVDVFSSAEQIMFSVKKISWTPISSETLWCLRCIWKYDWPVLDSWSKLNWIMLVGGYIHGWGTTQRREWILDELRNRFCTIFATDSWQRTRGHDEGDHKMTNIIHNYRFVKPHIIHNIALCIKILDTSLQGCWGMYNKDNMLVWTYVCLFVSICFLFRSPDAQIG